MMNPYKKERVHNFLRTFLPALTHAHQYTISHRLTAESINTTFTHLLEAIGKDPSLLLIIVDERIVVDKEPLEDSLYTGRFIEFLRSREIEHLCFLQGITLKELTRFIETVAGRPMFSTEGFVSSETFPHIQQGKVGVGYKDGDLQESDKGEEGKGGKDQSDTNRLVSYYEALRTKDTTLASEIRDAVAGGGRLPDQTIKRFMVELITTLKQESSLLLTFFPLRLLDEYTFSHSTNVSILTLAQGMALGIKDDLLHDLGIAAMLHDIGKIFIPADILNKTGKLTDEEWQVMKEHPRKGASYLADKPGIPSLAVIVAYEHHMAYDGSGYPQRAGVRRQNLCSQMTAIADFFDSLRTKRVYRDSVEEETIIKEMADMSGKTLNPALTGNFLTLLKKLVQVR